MLRRKTWGEEDNPSLGIRRPDMPLAKLTEKCVKTIKKWATESAIAFPKYDMLELGSYLGGSTVLIARTLIKYGHPDSRLYAIDSEIPSLWGRFINNLEQFGVSEVVVPYNKKTESVIWKKPISFLFIDCDHTMPGIRYDFEKYSKWVVPGGIVMAHDYGEQHPGVKKYFQSREFPPNGFNVAEEVGVMLVLKRKPERGEDGKNT